MQSNLKRKKMLAKVKSTSSKRCVKMTKQKYLTCSHLAIFLFSQGIWKEGDKQAILERIYNLSDRKGSSFLSGPIKNQRNEESCAICFQIFNFFEEIKGKNDGLLFNTHNIIDIYDINYREDQKPLLKFIKIMLQDHLIKKLYLILIGGFKKIGEDSKTRREIDIKKYIVSKKLTRKEFELIITNDEFNKNFLYEIQKEYY